MNAQLQKDIFIGFFRAGMLGYGGGPSAIPLVHAEVVGRYGWMTDEEFTDVLALGNTLPGPIATKMAGYIGYKTAGWLGLVNAIIATVLPSVVIMIALVGGLSAFRESPAVRGMTEAIAPIIAVMLVSLAYSMFKDARKGLGWAGCIGLTLGSFLLMELLGLHPGILIGVLLLYGLAGQDALAMLSKLLPGRGKRTNGKEQGKGQSM